jgi:hypothetical protein
MDVDNQNCLFVRFNWDHTALPYDPSAPDATFKDIHLQPTPSFPVGRKGLALISYWEQMQRMRPYLGMLIMDGDVAVDPLDIHIMRIYISESPEAVITAPIRLWYEGEWFWSHRGAANMLNDMDPDEIHFFSFGFTYLPKSLMEAASDAGIHAESYPYVDEFVSKLAVKMGLEIKLAEGCTPKHMHF